MYCINNQVTIHSKRMFFKKRRHWITGTLVKKEYHNLGSLKIFDLGQIQEIYSFTC